MAQNRLKRLPHLTQITKAYLIVAALGLMGLGLFYPIHPDEAVFLTIAREVSRGSLPYRDVFDHKPPGIYYLFAPLMSWIGTEVWKARLAVAVVNLVSAGLLYALGKQALGKQWSIWLGLFWLIGMNYYQGSFVLTESFAVGWMLVAVWLLKDETDKLNQVFLAGICLGVAGLFKQTALLMLPAVWWLWPQVEIKVRLVTVFLLGSLLPWVITFGYFALIGIAEEAFFDIVTYNVLVYPKLAIAPMLHYLPGALVVFPGVWGLLMGALFEKKKDTGGRWERFVWASLGWLGLSLLVRPYHHYWLLVFPWALLLVFRQLKRRPERFWLILVNYVLFTLFFTHFSISQVSGRLASQTRRQIPCREIREPYQYFLSQCPVPKFFYQPDLTSGQ